MKKQAANLIGRENEIARFEAAAKRAFGVMPTLLLYDGEPGSGRSTLLDALEAAPQLSGRRTRVIRIAIDAQIPDPVKHAADLVTHAKFFARFGGRSRASAFVSKVLPEWIGAIPLVGDVLEAITVTIQAVRRRFRKEKPKKYAEDISQLHHFVHAHSLALLIDQAEAMNESAADRLLRFVDAAPEQSRLLVVCMVRTPPPGKPQPPVRMLRHHLEDERLITHRLEAFSLSEMHQWLSTRFSKKPLPPPVINFLLAETGGQPGLVLKVIDELIERGILHETDDGWSYESLTGADVIATDEAASFLGALRADVADIVRSASIFGDEFDALTLAQLIEMDELDLEDRLAVAVRFGLLTVAGEWAQPGGEISTLYRFASSAVRAALHRSLSPELRQAFETRMSAL